MLADVGNALSAVVNNLEVFRSPPVRCRYATRTYSSAYADSLPICQPERSLRPIWASWKWISRPCTAPRISSSRPAYSNSTPRRRATGTTSVRPTGMLGTVRSSGRTGGSSVPYRRSATGVAFGDAFPATGPSNYLLRDNVGPRTSATTRRSRARRPTLTVPTSRWPDTGSKRTTSESQTTGILVRPLRTWTDDTGTYSTRARLLHFEAGTVWLRKADEGLVKIPISRLSLSGQEFVRTHATLKKIAARGVQ